MRICAVFILLISLPGLACSIFMQPENGMVAKNFDWSLANGELIIRPANAYKKSLNSQKDWVSQYGSVTFNQYGPDLPAGGMNTQGLMMEALVLGETRHPLVNGQLSLNEAEFIQYNLDNFRTVDEVVANVEDLQIQRAYVPIHYFTCDASGKCAVIEFINHQVKIYDQLEIPILTNMAYEKVLALYKGQEQLNNSNFASYPRFKALADYELSNFSKPALLKKLNQAKVPGMTVWQILYDPAKKTIDFLHIFDSQPVSVNLRDLDFNCAEALQALSFEDRDQTFSQKDLSDKLLRRRSSLSDVDEGLVQELAHRELRNHCH